MEPLNLVIPLSDVSQVEKLEPMPNDQLFNNSIIITLKLTSTKEKPPFFIFSQILEREFFLKNITELLGNLEM